MLPTGKYIAAFLFPLGNEKSLDDDGWVFMGIHRLPQDAPEFLVRELGMELTESYLGMDRYVGNNLQATVVHDDQGGIEHIMFKIYRDSRERLEIAFRANSLKNNSNLFFP